MLGASVRAAACLAILFSCSPVAAQADQPPITVSATPVDQCYILAASPTDPARAARPVMLTAATAPAAFEACNSAVKRNPKELRFRNQLLAAAIAMDKSEAELIAIAGVEHARYDLMKGDHMRPNHPDITYQLAKYQIARIPDLKTHANLKAYLAVFTRLYGAMWRRHPKALYLLSDMAKQYAPASKAYLDNRKAGDPWVDSVEDIYWLGLIGKSIGWDRTASASEQDFDPEVRDWARAHPGELSQRLSTQAAFGDRRARVRDRCEPLSVHGDRSPVRHEA